MEQSRSMAAGNSYSKNYFTPRNILIYVVIGVIVYGLIYYFVMNKNTTSQAPYGDTMTEEETMTMTVSLSVQNESGEEGTAALTEADGKTTVSISLTGAPIDVEQPAHIHAGACPTPGDVVYPLTNVVNGFSETVLDVDLATLKGQLPLAVNVHKSTPEISVYVACGDLL